MMKNYILDLGNKQTGFFQVRTNNEEKHFVSIALNKLNSFHPSLNFSTSDLIRMGLNDFCNRILNEKCKIEISIPEKEISFNLKAVRQK